MIILLSLVQIPALKKTSLLFALICITLSSFGQKIHFGDSTNIWSVIDSTTGCCIPYPTVYTTANYIGSVEYNGHTYLELNDPEGFILVREENNRVYAINSSDSIERVIYDFNLAINDTLKITTANDTFVSWVSALDSTLLAGVSYKVWHFNGAYTSTYFPDSTRTYQYNVIEGIGCTNGPGYPARAYSLKTFSEQLMCFNNHLNISSTLSVPVTSYGFDYTGSYDNGTSCTVFKSFHPDINVGIAALSKRNDVNVYPQPITETSLISLPDNIPTGTLTITNLIGQTIINQQFSNQSQLMVGNLIQTSGIYFYRVFDFTTLNIWAGKLEKL